jgi:hypothetical protein
MTIKRTYYSCVGTFLCTRVWAAVLSALVIGKQSCVFILGLATLQNLRDISQNCPTLPALRLALRDIHFISYEFLLLRETEPQQIILRNAIH